MPAENGVSVLTELPLWIQAALTVGAGVATAIGGVVFGKRGHKRASEREEDTNDFLESSPIRKFLSAVDAIADNQRLQTEALKTIAAASVAMAKLVEEDFDERRVAREVERRLKEKVSLR